MKPILKVIFKIWLISFFLLSAPSAYLALFKIDKSAELNSGIIELIFIVASGALVIEFFAFLFKKNKELKTKRFAESKIKKYLNALSDKEKSVLREFHIENQYVLYLPLFNPVVINLKYKGIITLINEMVIISGAGNLGPFKISDNIKEFLTPELLDLK